METYKQIKGETTNKGNFRVQDVNQHRREHLWKEKGRDGGSKSDVEGQEGVCDLQKGTLGEATKVLCITQSFSGKSTKQQKVQKGILPPCCQA